MDKKLEKHAMLVPSFSSFITFGKHEEGHDLLLKSS